MLPSVATLNCVPSSTTTGGTTPDAMSLQDRLQKTTEKTTPRPSRRRDEDTEGVGSAKVSPQLQDRLPRKTELPLSPLLGVISPPVRGEVAPTEVAHMVVPVVVPIVEGEHDLQRTALQPVARQWSASVAPVQNSTTGPARHAAPLKAEHLASGPAIQPITESLTDAQSVKGDDVSVQPGVRPANAPAAQAGVDSDQDMALAEGKSPPVPQRLLMPATATVAKMAGQRQSRESVILTPVVSPQASVTTVTVPFSSFGPGHVVVAALPLTPAGLPRSMLLGGTSTRIQRAVSTALASGTTPDGDRWEIQSMADANDEQPTADDRRRYPEHGE